MNGDFILLVGAPIARAVSGWAQKALQDNTISVLEWKKLLNTVLRLGVPSAALYFGLNLDVEVATAIPIIADYIFDYFVKYMKKRKAHLALPAA